MFRTQRGLCAVCGNPETIIDKKTGLPILLSVDHHHETGQVRALLCRGCNTAFGLLKEDPDRIYALLHYAEVWQLWKEKYDS